MARNHKDEAPGRAGTEGFQQGTTDGANRSGAAGAGQPVCKGLEGQQLRSDLHRVGGGLSVRFVLTAGQLGGEWIPRPPKDQRELQSIWTGYTKARHQFLTEVARQIGGTVAVVDVSKGGAS